MTWLITAAVLGVVGAFASARHEHSEGLFRRRLQLLIAACAVGIACLALLLTAHLLFGVPPLSSPAGLAGLLVLPVAIAGCTNKTMLGFADRVLLVSVQLGGAAIAITAILVLFVVGIGGPTSPGERGALGLALLAIAVVAALASFLWGRLSSVARTFTYGDRPAPGDIPRDLDARLTRAAPPDEMLLQFGEVLHSGLRLRSLELWAVSEEGLVRRVALPHGPEITTSVDLGSLDVLARVGVTGRSWLEVWIPDLAGPPERNVRVAPATHGGSVLAIVVAERDQAGDPFTPLDDDLMTDVARRLGGLLHGQKLDAELQLTLEELRAHAQELEASRARIVVAADEERRRLERDLHDGAQQRLVALTVQLAVAREVLKDDVDEAERLLAELSNHAREAITELRALAHGIYPPILQSGGLAGALPDAAARAPISTDVELEGVDRYSREIESAVYFCCLEAMQNAAKHAGDEAKTVIRVTGSETQVTFEVADNGRGFDAGSMNGGRGFTNMSDRLGAIGGRIEISSRPGEGTSIKGYVPTARPS